MAHKKLTLSALLQLAVKPHPTQEVDAFTNKTVLEPELVIDKRKLKELTNTYDLYNLKNIEQTGNNKGSLCCDDSFLTFLRTRQQNTLKNRLNDHDSWSWWLLVAGIIGLIIFLTIPRLLTPKVLAEKAKREQLEFAKQQADLGLHGKEYRHVLTTTDGPLVINVEEYVRAASNSSMQDYLKAQADSIDKQAKVHSDALVHQRDSLKKLVYVRIDHIKDSVMEPAKKEAIAIKKNAEKNNTSKNYKSEISRSNQVIADAESSAKLLTASFEQNIRAIDARYDSLLKATDAQTRSALADITKQYESLTTKAEYNLGDIDEYYSSGPWYLRTIIYVISAIFALIGIGMCVYVFFTLPKDEEKHISRTPENLRTMAFPGRTNSNAGSYGDKCDIVVALTPQNQEKLNSVTVRYPWHMLVSEASFDFNDSVLNLSERVQPLHMKQAIQPLLYVEEGDYVIIYAGLDSLPKDDNDVTHLISTNIVEEEGDNLAKNNGKPTDGNNTNKEKRRVL